MDNSIAQYWDRAAATFDDEPDHGLRAPATRAAWARLLGSLVPAEQPLDVLDLGCGTGSLSLLLAEAGHRVTGVDLSPEMVERAGAKLAASGRECSFLVGDAAEPPEGLWDVLLCRHLVWTLPAPVRALREWVSRLRPGGVLVLVEGHWREAEPYAPGAETLPWGAGVSAAQLSAAVRPLVSQVDVRPLSGVAELWGGPVDDERYALVATVGGLPA